MAGNRIITCSNCSARLKVSSNSAGKCPRCATEFSPVAKATIARGAYPTRALVFIAFIAIIAVCATLVIVMRPLRQKTDVASVEENRTISKTEVAQRTNDTPQPGEERNIEIAIGVKMTFCWIPPGEAILGSKYEERELVRTRHGYETEPEWLTNEAEQLRGNFQSHGYWLGKYEVTQKQWEVLMNTTPFQFHKDRKISDSFKEYDTMLQNRIRGMDTSNFPAESISWFDCKEYINQLNARNAQKNFAIELHQVGKFKLPTEYEWEYACRGGLGNRRFYYWGNELNGDKANIDGTLQPVGTTVKGVKLERPSPVGSYEKLAPHPWRLCDMIGNVQEWCEDWGWNGQEFKITRGGYWGSAATRSRAADRNQRPPSYEELCNGFRVMFQPNN